MTERLIDTNVLIVASAASDQDVRYEDVAVGPKDIERVVDWLIKFRDDRGCNMVLDETFKIYDEYNNKLNPQHFGLQVIHQKMVECLLTVPVEYDIHGHGIVPEALAKVDKSDKKFVAAALFDPESIQIVNACDSDWEEHKTVLQQHGIVILELLR